MGIPSTTLGVYSERMTAFVTLAEAADKLGKSRRTVGRMIVANELPGAVKGARGWQIPANALDVPATGYEAITLERGITADVPTPTGYQALPELDA